MKVVDLPSRFFGVRRLPIRYIVLHTTQGTDSREWLTKTGNVSAHYLVQRDTVYRLVSEELEAWHAGRIAGTPTTPLYDGRLLPDGTWLPNPNSESIGIEMEGHAATRIDDATIRATAELIWDIRERRGRLPLVSHSELSPGDRSDPGAHNRQAVEALLGEEDEMDAETKAAILQTAQDTRDIRDTLNALAKTSLPEWMDRLGDRRDVHTGLPQT